MQQETEDKQAAIRQEVEESLDLEEVLRDMAVIGAMMDGEEEEEEEEEEENEEEKAAFKRQAKGSLQEEYISLRQAYRQLDEERELQQQQQQQQGRQSVNGGVVSSVEMFPEGQGEEDVISLKRPEPVQSVDEMLGVRPIDRESNVCKEKSELEILLLLLLLYLLLLLLLL